MKRIILIMLLVAVFSVASWSYLLLNQTNDKDEKNVTDDSSSEMMIDNESAAEDSKDEEHSLIKVGQVVGTYVVDNVIDGDTFNAGDGTEMFTIRVLGIDTPEKSDSGAECYSAEATAQAKKLLSGSSVTLLTDSTQDTFDAYGRLLAYVQLADGADFGQVMIEGGYAKEYTFKGIAYGRQPVYQQSESLAKEKGVGLWSCQ